MLQGVRGRVAAGMLTTLFVLALAAPGAHAAPKAGDPLGHALAKATGACNDLDPSVCMLPFPNDRYTKPADTPTGKRIAFPRLAMPRNAVGLPIDPAEWNRNDGFSPGSMALTFVPGLDLHKTFGIDYDVIQNPAITIATGKDGAATSPIVLVDAGSVVDPPKGRPARPRLHPFWAELDHHPDTAPDQRLLLIRPTVALKEGHRYIVALRDLRDVNGNVIPPGPAFQHLTGARAAHYNSDIFPVLQKLGIKRQDLYLAWDFTVASEQNLAGRALAIRDDAFAKLGDTDLADGTIQGHAPRFAIDSVSTKEDGTRTVRGSITVPNYLNAPDELKTPPIDDPTGKLTDLASQDLPLQHFYYGTNDPGPMATPKVDPLDPTREADFVCTIPPTASPEHPATPMLYGHGLLGSKDESTGGSTARMRERNYMPCATDWIGMSEHDLGNVVLILTNLSLFQSLADRTQQAFLNFMYLGRALKAADGLATDPAFQQDGKPIIASGKLVYDGNSQGGIMGGALTALSPDLTRAVIGVPGMNYSTLLNRSVDWEGEYAVINYTAYPDKQVQQLDYDLLQMLWDRGEADGYAAHITTDPLPDTPQHAILMQAAFGDYQVANVAAEVEARSIGAALLRNSVPARHWAQDPAFGFPSTFGGKGRAGRHKGSALVYFDSGNPTPPDANVPPPDHGADPHEIPRRDPDGADQKDAFYRTGVVVDVHDGGPYCTYTYPIDKSVTVPACEAEQSAQPKP